MTGWVEFLIHRDEWIFGGEAEKKGLKERWTRWSSKRLNTSLLGQVSAPLFLLSYHFLSVSQADDEIVHKIVLQSSIVSSRIENVPHFFHFYFRVFTAKVLSFWERKNVIFFRV